MISEPSQAKKISELKVMVTGNLAEAEPPRRGRVSVGVVRVVLAARRPP